MTFSIKIFNQIKEVHFHQSDLLRWIIIKKRQLDTASFWFRDQILIGFRDPRHQVLMGLVSFEEIFGKKRATKRKKMEWNLVIRSD